MMPNTIEYLSVFYLNTLKPSEVYFISHLTSMNLNVTFSSHFTKRTLSKLLSSDRHTARCFHVNVTDHTRVP